MSMMNVILSGMAWDNAAAALVTALVLWLPGLVLASTLGLRGWLLVGTAPAVTMGLIGVGAPLFAMTGLFWSPLKFTAWCLGITGIAAVGVLGAQTRLRADRPDGALVPFGHADSDGGGRGLRRCGSLVVAGATKGLGNVPLGWDAPFHGNAIRLIAETGNTSTRFLGWIDLPDNVGATFYPNAFHCFEALVYSLSAEKSRG